MNVRVRWIEQATFIGESGSGHIVAMDGAPEHGGRELAPRPMEMLLLGLGGCTTFDVVQILRKSRQSVTDCEVAIEAERADTVPAVFTRIHLHFVVTGRDVSERMVQRAIQLSEEKYCSATRMLAATAAITHDYEILAQGKAKDRDE